MSNIANISDLTKINVEIDFKMDSLDSVLFITTGGLGVLAGDLPDQAFQRVIAHCGIA